MKPVHIELNSSIITNPLNSALVKQYLEKGAVKEFTIKQEEGSYLIQAKLSLFGIEDNCTLTVDEKGNIFSYVCSCNQSDEVFTCVHIDTLICFVNELQIDHIPFSYENLDNTQYEKKREEIKEARELRWINEEVSDSRTLMEKAKIDYTNRINTQLQDESYEIQATLEFEYGEQMAITYRVGNGKFYIIKDIEAFIDRVDCNESYSYGKKLSFIHKMDAFDEISQKQIEFMRSAMYTQKNQTMNRYGYYVESVARRIYINSANIDKFYDTYLDNDGENFFCKESDELQHISVKENKNIFQYIWDRQQNTLAGEKHLYSCDRREPYSLTRYSLDEEGKTLRFLLQLQKKPMSVLKSENDEFYKYVLSDITGYLDIDKINSMRDRLDLIKLYADIDDGDQIFAKLVYYNEDGVHQHGFDEENLTTYTQDLVESIIKKYARVIDYDAHIAYFDAEGEDVYNFIYTGLPMLSEHCEVFVSEALKRLGVTQKYTITVGVKLVNNLLEIDMDSIEIPKEELSEVLRAYRRKKKFFRLKNGKLLNLNSNDLEELDQFVEEYHLPASEVGKDIQIPAYRMLALEDDMKTKKNLLFERNEQFSKRVEDWHKLDTSQFEVPKIYQKVLRDYQKDGFGWLNILTEYGFDGILADDMGLGKTIQVIALLESRKDSGVSVVVCPASLVYNWEDEINKFSSHLKTCCIVGNAKERISKIHAYHQYDLLITSYDYIRRDIDEYDGISFSYAILDEAQNIKNQKTKNAISVKKLKANHRLALTGTPIENSLAELWSIFDFLMPNYLYNYHYFQSHFENDIIKNNNEEKQQKLKQLVAPFILRRTKKEVLKELPDKIEKNYLIDFNEEEEKLYMAHLAQVNTELKALTHMEGNDKIAILAMLTRLRQLCCEPRLLFENIEEPSSKLNACMDLIKTLKENNQKVLLFSSFTSMLDLIAEELYKENISYYILTGSTSKEDRRELVSQFQKDATSIFLISLKAGGTGLNLTAAEAVIHYDPWWNQSAQNQATDRAHRIGQTKKVQVFKLIMKNSIEEKIQKLQMMKKELADMFVENNEGSIARMSKEELMELFKI